MSKIVDSHINIKADRRKLRKFYRDPQNLHFLNQLTKNLTETLIIKKQKNDKKMNIGNPPQKRLKQLSQYYDLKHQKPIRKLLKKTLDCGVEEFQRDVLYFFNKFEDIFLYTIFHNDDASSWTLIKYMTHWFNLVFDHELQTIPAQVITGVEIEEVNNQPSQKMIKEPKKEISPEFIEEAVNIEELKDLLFQHKEKFTDDKELNQTICFALYFYSDNKEILSTIDVLIQSKIANVTGGVEGMKRNLNMLMETNNPENI